MSSSQQKSRKVEEKSTRYSSPDLSDTMIRRCKSVTIINFVNCDKYCQLCSVLFWI